MSGYAFLPGTGRGTSRRLVEGRFHRRGASWRTPSTTALRPAVPLLVPGRKK
jgi:hypothetical protein